LVPSTFATRGLAKKAKGKKKQKGSSEAAEKKVEEVAAAAADDESGEEELLDLLDPTSLEGYREDCFESLKVDYASIRPNRATPGMLDHILVSAYEGEQMPLKHLATSHVRDVSTLVVSLYDPQTLQAVEKAILQSPLELNPFVEGEEIIVRVPTPTEESKQQLCKIARSQAENTKVRLRKLRQRAMQQAKQVSDKDERKTIEKQLDKFFEEALNQTQDLCANKEQEIMS
jgi:ribosome recycling factor